MRRGERAIVDFDRWSLSPGELVCLLGPSGSGKTSFLRLLAGLETPDSGNISRDGLVISGERFVPPQRRGMGMMFQEHALFPHMTVIANCMFGLRSLGRRQARDAAMDALSKVDLAWADERYPDELSGGECQRCALARTIAPRPGIILLDEPFSSLDQNNRDEIRPQILQILRETGASTVLVTHDAEEALRVADRITVIGDGKILQDCPARQLYDRPSTMYSARCFGELNEVSGVARSGLASSRIGAAKSDVADGSVCLCWRPQSIQIAPLEGQLTSHCKFHGEACVGPFVVGSVSAVRFLGSSYIIEVSVNGLPLSLRIRSDLDTVYRVGQLVKLRGPGCCALVFAQKPEWSAIAASTL